MILVSKRKGKVKTKGFTTKLVQLYNIEEDPTEKKELSDQHPKLVNIMLTKLADYYVSFLGYYSILMCLRINKSHRATRHMTPEPILLSVTVTGDRGENQRMNFKI